MDIEHEIFVTHTGSKCLSVGGYLYGVRQVSKNGTTRWRCIEIGNTDGVPFRRRFRKPVPTNVIVMLESI